MVVVVVAAGAGVGAEPAAGRERQLRIGVRGEDGGDAMQQRVGVPGGQREAVMPAV